MKQILISCLLLFIVYSSYSQVNFGLKSGVNIATTKDLITLPKNRIGWYGGGFVKLPLPNNFFLQTELLYSGKGFKYIGNTYSDKKTPVRLNYLSAPILLGYKIDRKTSLLIGAEIAYLLSANTIYVDGKKNNISNYYPVKFDLGLDVGISYVIWRNIGAEIRYNYGFKSMYYTDALGNRIGEGRGGNRVFQIGGFYSFPFTK